MTIRSASERRRRRRRGPPGRGASGRPKQGRPERNPPHAVDRRAGPRVVALAQRDRRRAAGRRRRAAARAPRVSGSSTRPTGTSASDCRNVWTCQKPRSAPPWTNGTQIGPTIMPSAVPSSAIISDAGGEAQRTSASRDSPGRARSRGRTGRAAARASPVPAIEIVGTRASTPSSDACQLGLDRGEPAGRVRQRDRGRDHQRRDDEAEARGSTASPGT